VAYAVIGRGRWWRTPVGAWVKGAVLTGCAFLLIVPATAISMGLVVLAVKYLP
jgi:hypothetical protein